MTAREGSIGGAIAAVQDHLPRLEAGFSAYAGALLMVPHIGQRIVSFELWSSPSALAASEANVRAQDQHLSRSGMLEVPPRREVLEISGYC